MLTRSCSLAIVGITLLGSTAHARGIYLQVFEQDSQGKLRMKHMLEKTPCVRCTTTVQQKINRGGETVASCRSTGTGYVVVLADRGGVKLKVVHYDASLKPTWDRTIEGQLAYSGDLAFSRADVFALARGGGYEILWLSLENGKTVRSETLAIAPGDVATAQVAPSDFAPNEDFYRYGCDPIGPWLRSQGKVQALVCRVLD